PPGGVDVAARPRRVPRGEPLDERLKRRVTRKVGGGQLPEQLAQAGLRVALGKDLLPGLWVDRELLAEEIPDEPGQVLDRPDLRLAEQDDLAKVVLPGRGPGEECRRGKVV